MKLMVVSKNCRLLEKNVDIDEWCQYDYMMKNYSRKCKCKLVYLESKRIILTGARLRNFYLARIVATSEDAEDKVDLKIKLTGCKKSF